MALGVIESGLGGGEIQIRGLHFFGELLADGFLDLAHFNFEKLGDHADVHHVLDQLAQLGFGANRGDDFVVGDGVENQIVAQLVESERFVVENGGAGRERHDVVLRGFGIHRDQEIDFFLAADVAIFVGANGVPGGQTGDVRGKKILAGNRHAHLENGTQQNCV